MSAQAAFAPARTLAADEKGPFAMDESDGAGNRGFAKAGIPEDSRRPGRADRDLIVATPGLGANASAARSATGLPRRGEYNAAMETWARRQAPRKAPRSTT